MAADSTTKVLVYISTTKASFSTKDCTVVSLYDSDYNSVVRIYVGHSEVVKH